jgi:hypothetical protein
VSFGHGWSGRRGTSFAPLVAADTNGLCDTYLTQIGSGTFTLVSQGNAGQIGDEASCSSGSPPSISTDGRFVGYSSYATNFYVGDPDPDDADAWLYDRLHA